MTSNEDPDFYNWNHIGHRTHKVSHRVLPDVIHSYVDPYCELCPMWFRRIIIGY
jgi:hypothetical protein